MSIWNSESRQADSARPFFSLNVFTIRIPPLRERADDLELLTQFFLRRFAVELGKESPVVRTDVGTIAPLFLAGNVRELQSVLKRSLLQMRGSVLAPEFLRLESVLRS